MVRVQIQEMLDPIPLVYITMLANNEYAIPHLFPHHLGSVPLPRSDELL